MACIYYASKIQELRINGEIISSHLHPLHLQRLPTEQVLFSFKKVSNIWENCTEKLSHAFWGQVTILRV